MVVGEKLEFVVGFFDIFVSSEFVVLGWRRCGQMVWMVRKLKWSGSVDE